MRFIAGEISKDSYVNIMAQYRPAWHAVQVAEQDPAYHGLKRPVTREEYQYAVRCARDAGLHRGFPDGTRQR
jgi:putative pyruvate formate lyase activating enzyme